MVWYGLIQKNLVFLQHWPGEQLVPFLVVLLDVNPTDNLEAFNNSHVCEYAKQWGLPATVIEMLRENCVTGRVILNGTFPTTYAVRYHFDVRCCDE